ncbi:UNVERIFIED_CONTAM: hypothetical protein Sindi_0733900 [Sesamum indicum]
MSSSRSSSDSNSTSATISHRVGSSIPHEGPSRVRLRHRSRRDQLVEEFDDTPTYVMPKHSPWEGIVSTVKQQVHLIKEKYYIPNSFEVMIPRSCDRMHRPPRGFCAFSLNHFDAGLRLPLALYVAQILRRLELCPMQLGFFYLSVRRDCRYLDPLTSNVGPSYWYDPKRILVEEVLKLAHLSPAPIPIEGSLDDMVTQARLTQHIRAAQARATAESVAPLQVAPPSATSSRPGAENSIAPEESPPRNPLSIDVRSKDTRSRGLLRDVSHKVLGSLDRSRTDESSPGGSVGRRRRRDSTFVEERRNMEMLNDIANCWRKAREDLRTPHHLTAELSGEKLIPDWKVSSSCTVLGSQSGQETWELYNASCLSRDQAALLQTSFTHLEEHAAHSLIQAANFVRGLPLKCVGFRRNQIITERRNRDLRAKVSEATARGEDLENQRGTLEARVKELEEKMSSKIAKATESGKEIGFAAGHAARKIAGAIEDYLMQGFDRCKAQVSTLNGFAPKFDATRLDPGLDGKLQPFPDEEAPPPVEEEFAILLNEIEQN